VEYPHAEHADAAGASAALSPGIVDKLCVCGCGRPLSGRQTKYASKDCANRIYETARPRILNASAGAPREGTIKAAVLGVLFDREWHSAHELAAAVKADKHSVVTRISELRKHFAIEEDLPVGNSRRSHRYRLAGRALDESERAFVHGVLCASRPCPACGSARG
jgi:hypothetical protein